jgi:hypothetical protein
MGMFYNLYLFPVYFMMFLLLCWTQSIRQDCLGKNQTSYPVNVDKSRGDILIKLGAGIRQKGGKEAALFL